ncbi:myc protein [Nylanderia fulva]|uniref:myc protein n=1 Tax=Nylanderia fulva TaxID=613905 RepID=UPI0010FB60B9|nr:myc protein [Nylanderia fulva]
MELMHINSFPFHPADLLNSRISAEWQSKKITFFEDPSFSVCHIFSKIHQPPRLRSPQTPKLVAKDSPENGKDDLRYKGIRTEPTTFEEEAEESKREKDWTERRKFDEVDDQIVQLENDIYQKNADMENRVFSSFLTCWNDCSLSGITERTYKNFHDCDGCCSDYHLHKIFSRKESMDRMWNVQDSLKVKTERTFIPPLSHNYSTVEDHVDSKPTLVKIERTQFWCPKNLPRSMPRSLLKNPVFNSRIVSAAHSLANPPSNNSCTKSRTLKNLESDGDSPRSTSPQSSVADEEEIFSNIRISREWKNEKLSDYISEGAASAGRDSSLSNDRRRRKEEEEEEEEEEEDQLSTSILESDIRRHTLSDHCYHQSRSMERTRRDTFSETDEEEIDVVSYEKKVSYFNLAHKKHNTNQLAMNNFAQKQHSASQLSLNITQKQQSANQLAANTDNIIRRPRGRPPGPNSAKRKKAAQMALNETSSPKRARMQSIPRGQKRGPKYVKQWRNQSYKDEDDDDVAKRNLHNDMERQRRISMKNSFDELKQHVPAIADKDRVAKVTILKQAEAFVKEQQIQETYHMKQVELLQIQNSLLQRKVKKLMQQRKMPRMYRHN